MADKGKDEDQSEKPIFGPETEDISAASQGQSVADAQPHVQGSATAISDESQNIGLLTKVTRILNWMPQRCRYDPENPPKFTLSMNILLAFVCQCQLPGGQALGRLTANRAEPLQSRIFTMHSPS